MALPPRPFLTEEQIRALSPEERAVAIAEWSSYNARLRREQEQRAVRGSYRGAARAMGRGRGRGSGRGHYGYQPYQPYHPIFTNVSATFGTKPTTPARAVITHTPAKPSDSLDTPCPAFTATGVCKRKHCNHVHDPDKTAICKPFLFKSSCPNGSSCPLSHVTSPNRSPHCIHFQNDSCNKEDCQYAHVRVNAAAPVCQAFARLGYCEEGAQCADRHSFGECPDFTNKGNCQVKGCRLAHVVHAGRLRQAARAPSTDAEPSSAIDTPESVHGSVTPEIEDLNTHALTQQADFVPFES